MKKITVAVMIMLCMLSIAACTKKENTQGHFNPEDISPDHIIGVSEGEELLCIAESEQEAENIAELYGIELVRFSHGIAVFHTDEDLEAVAARGAENGWPELSPNTVQYALGNS